MKITCGDCHFSIQTLGADGSFLEGDEIKFCIKCGKSYAETGVNVPRIYYADDMQVKCQTRTMLWFGLLPFISFSFLIGTLLVTNTIRISQNVALLIPIVPVIYLGVIFWFALRRGKKKFKKVVNA